MTKKPTEHRTVQARILSYAQEIGWTYVPREVAEARRGFDTGGRTAELRARQASRFFRDILFWKVRDFNPAYEVPAGSLESDLNHLTADIAGNRALLEYLRNHRTFSDAATKRERNLQIIAYEDIGRPDDQRRNQYEVTEEYAVHNGRFGIREDIVFLVNGIPVLVIECKNASKDEAIALGVEQIRRYHTEVPQIMVPEMLFTTTEAIGFAYGATWNTLRRNIFDWKSDEKGNLEKKIKSFCDRDHLLRCLRDFILFAEQEEALQKFILRQHQVDAVDKVVERALDTKHKRGLVWHTQGSGKTYTMIKAAELLFKANIAKKPTILLMIDRNELEDQLIRNLASLGLDNVAHADRIRKLNDLLDESGQDYRGIVVSMIHKFRDMPPGLNKRDNVFVLIDEAHRTTGGDLGNFLMAGLPNATFIGFTGTPVDKTAHGKGTFKTFGTDDPDGYLHKYSIKESIEDRTTLPLYYNLAPNEMLVPHELMEAEFFAMAETEGIADIQELNAILERAVNLKNFLKGTDRVRKVAAYVATHYVENVEPLGYKAFLVAVDREACAFYKEALDALLPPDYSAVVFTGSNNDKEHLKKWHIDEKREKVVRKDFSSRDKRPKILIVTEKLLTGFDAPILYAMYLDKPMRDHTLLQAIARVNRPYEDEAAGIVKPHGFVLDFVGIFDKLERALAFDSDEIDAIVKDLSLLKVLFKSKMESVMPPYLELVSRDFNDRDVDNLIEHFKEKGTRQEFFREYRELEMLYEIISPDAFLRPFMDEYAAMSAIYAVVRNAFVKRIYVDRDFQRKTNELVQKHVTVGDLPASVTEFVSLDADTIETINARSGGDATKVVNLVKSIEKAADEEDGDPFLVALADRARAVQESFEDRQSSTAEALSDLLTEIQRDQARRLAQAEKGLDALTYFVLQKLSDDGISNPEQASISVARAFTQFSNWRRSEAELRELRKKVTILLFAEEDDLDKVSSTVETLFELLARSFKT